MNLSDHLLEFHSKYNFKSLFLSDYDYNDFSVPPLEGDGKFVDIPSMPLPESEE